MIVFRFLQKLGVNCLCGARMTVIDVVVVGTAEILLRMARRLPRMAPRVRRMGHRRMGHRRMVRRHHHPPDPLRLLVTRPHDVKTRERRAVVRVPRMRKMLGNRKALDRLDGEAVPAEGVEDQGRLLVVDRRKTLDPGILPPRRILARHLLILRPRRQGRVILLLRDITGARLPHRATAPARLPLPIQRRILTCHLTDAQSLLTMTNGDYETYK